MSETLHVTVYVPATGKLPSIAPGSAIVGRLAGNDDLLVDYEGNIYGVPALRRYAARVAHAYGHMVERYPTVARMLVNRDELVPVGHYDGTEVVTDDPKLLAKWLGIKVDELAEELRR